MKLFKKYIERYLDGVTFIVLAVYAFIMCILYPADLMVLTILPAISVLIFYEGVLVLVKGRISFSAVTAIALLFLVLFMHFAFQYLATDNITMFTVFSGVAVINAVVAGYFGARALKSRKSI